MDILFGENIHISSLYQKASTEGFIMLFANIDVKKTSTILISSELTLSPYRPSHSFYQNLFLLCLLGIPCKII